MSSIDFDGLCANIPVSGASSDQQVRCKYKFGHEGPHSYEATMAKGWVTGFFVHPVEEYTQKGKL